MPATLDARPPPGAMLLARPGPFVLRVRRWAMRLLEAFESFLLHLEHERQCAPGTLDAYRRDCLQFLAWLDRSLELERAHGLKRPVVRPNALVYFTTDRIRGWQASLSLERRLSPNAIRRKLHVLSSFAKFLIRTGALGPGDNPMATVIPPKKRKRVRQGLALETWRALLALPLSPREATIRGLFAWTGIRREELLTLTVGAVRLGQASHATILVRGKGDKERLVPVPPPLREVLLDYLLRTGKTGPRERLFTSPSGDPLHPSVINRLVSRWGKAVGAGVPVHPHLFRHTYATGLAASGLPLDVIQAWLGHEDLATTAEYLHAAHSGDARAKLDAWVGSVEPKAIAGPGVPAPAGGRDGL